MVGTGAAAIGSQVGSKIVAIAAKLVRLVLTGIPGYVGTSQMVSFELMRLVLTV